MCTADPGARRGAHAGFTLVEAAIVVAMLGLLSLLVEQTIRVVHDADTTLTTIARVQQKCDQVAYEIHRAVRSSRRLFVRGTTGNAYLESLDVRRRIPAPGCRLPLPDELDPLGPDLPGEPRTGNVLLFVREADPIACPADPATGAIRYVDVYRFMCIYPHEASPERVLVLSMRDSRDLVVWTSVPYANHGQLLSIADATHRTRVITALHDLHGVTHAWEPTGTVTDSFYALGPGGTISADPEASMVIAEDLAVSPGSRLVHADFQLARTDAASYDRKPFLTVEAATEWVPDGFEVKVVGASGQRKVWVRLVVEAQSPTQRDTVFSNTLVSSLRDL